MPNPASNIFFLSLVSVNVALLYISKQNLVWNSTIVGKGTVFVFLP